MTMKGSLMPTRQGTAVAPNVVSGAPEAARERLPGTAKLSVDSKPVTGGKLYLEEGRHRITVGPRSPASIISPLPREVFHPRVMGNRAHSPLFEYEKRAGPELVRPGVL